MNRYQIKVRDPDGEPIGTVEFDAKNPDLAVDQARETLERASDSEESDGGFPAGSEYVPEKLPAVTLWTVEHDDGTVEVEAKSRKVAEGAVPNGVAIAKRVVYPDSLVPVIHQGGPTPL